MSSFTQAFSKAGALAPYAYFYQGDTYWRPDTHVGETYNLAHWDNYATAADANGPGDWTVTIDVTSIPDGLWELVIRDKAGVSRDPAVDSFIATRQVTFSGGSGTSVGGRYVDQAYLEQVYDVENIRSWSRKGGSGATDTLAVQAAIDSAEDQIDRRLAFRYVLPFVMLSLTTADVQTLKRLAARIAVYELYKARGLRDDDAVGNLLTKDRDEALAELETYYAGQNFLNATRIDRVNRSAELVS